MGARAGRRRDRMVAFGAVALVAGAFVLVVFLVVAINDAPDPAPARRDPQAAAQLVDLMRRGERVDYVADYRFTRVATGAGVHTSEASVAHWGPSVVNREGDSLEMSLPKIAYHCQLVDGGSSCSTSTPVASIPPSQVFATAVATRAYNVTREPDATIAGERAQCFRIASVNDQPYLEAIGRATVSCFAADGVPLRTKIEHPNPTDDRVATQVDRRVDEAAVKSLLRGFEGKTSAFGG